MGAQRPSNPCNNSLASRTGCHSGYLKQILTHDRYHPTPYLSRLPEVVLLLRFVPFMTPIVTLIVKSLGCV